MPSQSIPSGNYNQTRSEYQLGCQTSGTSPISLEEAVKRFIHYYKDLLGWTKDESYGQIFFHVMTLCRRGMIQDTSILDSDNPYGVIDRIVDEYWSS